MDRKESSLANLAANIKQGVDAHLKDVHTSMPGIIETFNAATQIASVQPAIKRIFKLNDGEQEILTPTALPILINVPVQFPRGGGFSLTFPVKKGDECLLVFCERSIDNWHKFGGIKKPGAKRFHSLSDATAFVGLSSLVNKVPNYDPINTELKKDDGTVSISLNNNNSMSIYADSDVIITSGTTVDITAPLITITGNLEITGTHVKHNGTRIDDQHTHSQGSDSDGDSEVNTDPPL